MPEVEEQAIPAAPETPVPTTEPTEVHPDAPQQKRYRKAYQPTDADGNPIGRPQVFESDDPQEVIDAIARAHEMATRRMHELRKQVQPDQQTEPFQFREQQLTDDERWQIAHEITDPAKMDTALDKALEARLGAPVAKIREVLNKTVETEQIQRGVAESQAFLNETPEYKICPKNQAAIQKYIVDNKLAWNRKNLKLAFEALAADGLVELVEENAPQPTPAPDDPPEQQHVETIPPAAPQAAPRPTRTTSSALFRSSSSAIPGGGAAARRQSDEEFAKQVAKMSQDELRRRITGDPQFRARLDSLGKKK